MGGRTLMIKLTSAQLRYAATGAVAELGKNDAALKIKQNFYIHRIGILDSQKRYRFGF